MGKLVVVLVMLVGLLPVMLCASGCWVMLAERERVARALGRVSDENSAVFVHDTSLKIGGWEIGINPQWWSVRLLVAGIAMILVGLTAVFWPQIRG